MAAIQPDPCTHELDLETTKSTEVEPKNTIEKNCVAAAFFVEDER